MKASVVISTGGAEIKKELYQFFLEMGYEVGFEELETSTVLKLVESSIDLLIVDIRQSDEHVLTLLGVLRETIPDLTIITILDQDVSMDYMRSICELGVFYCLMKPLDMQEFEDIIDAFERRKILVTNVVQYQ